jgi:metallo-beta-lactamase family protein
MQGADHGARPAPGFDVATAIEFLGAADTVTGSRYLVTNDRARVLVDCGLFQGPKKLRLRNWGDPGFDAASVDAVILTHAHIDHSGYLPRLCKAGFTGRVWCTRGTRDLLQFLLPDAGFLQEEEARHANLGGYSRHHPALPLYTRDDAMRSLERLSVVGFDAAFEPAPGVRARFSRAGHIIGAACVHVETPATSIAFSGDVGRPHDPIMRAPAPLPAAAYVVVESTYGDRDHPSEATAIAAIADLVTETVERRGVVVVPAFAVGRAQHLLHLLGRLRETHRIPPCPIVLDSPMAVDATRVFCAHTGDHRLSAAECTAMCETARYVQSVDESKAIDRAGGPMIVVSASGMATGGRVLHHLRRYLPEPTTTVLFVGYQAAGTRGRTLVDGAKELKLQGQYVPVRARVVQLDGLSAHADGSELLEWLRGSHLAPIRVFVTHGEPSAADAMRRRLTESFGWDAVVPDLGQRFALDGGPR